MSLAAARTIQVCQSCGFRSPKWLGRCPGCEEWNSFAEESSHRDQSAIPAAPSIAYSQIDSQQLSRLPSGIGEVDRVLGGGLVPGSLILLGGEPGIGKSTLVLQTAERLSQQGLKVLYVAGEESAQQIKIRGDRLGLKGEQLHLTSETCLESILEETRQIRPQLLIVDSIQTVQSRKLDSIPGSISQIRECAASLLQYCKREGLPVFLVGHVTKDGALAGPKALEHIVDTVLYFEGDRHQNHKIVRAVKNRFGPANELGIFEMTGKGLLGVDSPSRLFLTERTPQVPGSVVFGAMEGSRPMLVEVQALVSQSNYSTARREANGIDRNRLSLLLAMLERRVGLQVLGSDVYVNVAGGLALTEPAVDLAVVAAVVSSLRGVPSPSKTVIFGELGLAGEIRAVNSPRTRVREAKSLGFKTVVLPQGNLPLAESVKGLHLQGVSGVGEYLEWSYQG